VWLLVVIVALLAFAELQHIYLGWSSPRKLSVLFAVGFTTLPACCYVSLLLGLSMGEQTADGSGVTSRKAQLSRLLVVA